MKADETFLPHLSEPLRRQIAIRYIQHEWRKLFPQSRGKDIWQSMDLQIAGWYEMLSPQNFWNAVHGITIGFRLTSIIPWITSLNVQWAEREVSFDELWFRGAFGPIAMLNAEIPELVGSVKEAIFEDKNKEFLEKTKEYFKSQENDTEPRDDFLIFVVRKDGKLRVIDGNGRTLKAIVGNKDSIRAVVGESIGEPALFEHWVPTSLLVDLVFWHKRQVKLRRETTGSVARVIAELIRDSSAGRTEFLHRGVHHNEEVDMRLLKAVAEILHGYNILFEVPKT